MSTTLAKQKTKKDTYSYNSPHSLLEKRVETKGYLKVQDIIPGHDLDHLHPISQLPEANT